MNKETLQILIEPRTNVHECINANTHTFILDMRNNINRYQCEIALPTTDETVCKLLKEYMTFPLKRVDYQLMRVVYYNEYHSWVDRMQSALSQMRSVENLAKDLKELGADYQFSQLQLVKFIKNKYQFGLKETKNLVDIYYATL